jgi:hypothetical protein
MMCYYLNVHFQGYRVKASLSRKLPVQSASCMLSVYVYSNSSERKKSPNCRIIVKNAIPLVVTETQGPYTLKFLLLLHRESSY